MKRFVSISIILISIAIIVSLIGSIYSLWQKQDLIKNARLELVREKSENSQLQKDLSRVDNTQFIEEEARNKLFLAKPNETEIIVPQEKKKAIPKKGEEFPNWKQWFLLFFNP